MKMVYKFGALCLCFALLCGCAQKAERKPLPEYSSQFAFGDKYTEVSVSFGENCVHFANMFNNTANQIYEKLSAKDFIPTEKPDGDGKNPLDIRFENLNIESGEKATAQFTLFDDNTLLFSENEADLYFKTDDSVYADIVSLFQNLQSENAKWFLQNKNDGKSVYSLSGIDGNTVSYEAESDRCFVTLYNENTLRITDGGSVCYFDREKCILSSEVGAVSDYSFGHIAYSAENKIKLISAYDSLLSYEIDNFEQPLKDAENSIYAVRFFDDLTLTVGYYTQNGAHSQKIDLTTYYKDYENKAEEAKKAAEKAAAERAASRKAVPQNYTYDAPQTVTKDGIPPFTAEMDARLMQFKNVRAGYGWKGAENRQSYYSQFNAFATGDRSKNVVYLTFDEGYEYNENTLKILDILKAKNVKAVFFVTMGFVKSRPDIVSRIINEGHALGNHSTTHPSFVNITTRQGYDEVKTLHDYILSNFGYNMTLFRFPEGVSSDRSLALIKEMGYAAVFWNCAYADWDVSKQPSYDTTRSLIANNTQNGTIYLFHAVSNTNVAMMGEIIDTVRGMGFEFGLFG